MNVNSQLMQVGQAVGYPIAPDIYTGNADKYLVFTYEDERGALFADNSEEYTMATIQVSFYCPATYNYMTDKQNIKNALINQGFQIESFESWVEQSAEIGTEHVRHSVYVVKIFNTEE